MDRRGMTYSTPKPLERPALAHWLWVRGILLREAGVVLECSYEQVRVICLPFGDENRRVPGEALLERIVEWTGGEITAADFYPPRLTAARVAPSDPIEPASAP